MCMHEMEAIDTPGPFDERSFIPEPMECTSPVNRAQRAVTTRDCHGVACCVGVKRRGGGCLHGADCNRPNQAQSVGRPDWCTTMQS